MVKQIRRYIELNDAVIAYGLKSLSQKELTEFRKLEKELQTVDFIKCLLNRITELEKNTVMTIGTPTGKLGIIDEILSGK